MIDESTKIVVYQAMGTCLVFIFAFIAYGVYLRRQDRRKREEVLDVMWKKPSPPKVSPLKEYNYDTKKTPTSDRPLNRAERRKDKQPSNGSNTVNWAD